MKGRTLDFQNADYCLNWKLKNKESLDTYSFTLNY